MSGKTPMWGNPMRDILFIFRRLNISSIHTISNKRKPLTKTQNHTTICCLEKCAKEAIRPV